MQEIKVSLAGRKYLVQLAQTPEDQEKGLSNISELEEDSGMLFVFDEEQEVGF